MTQVKFTTTHGPIVLELYDDKAPATVENFLQYVKSNFYEGTLFHRVIDGFVAQGGGLDINMQEKATRPPIKNEADNGVKNNKGTVAMARTADPHSASSQFFINLKDNHFLNYQSPTREKWGYCVFGEVSEGMDVVDKIRTVPTTTRAGHQDVPAESIVIESAEIIE